MGTTDTQAAIALLRLMDSQCIPYQILHNADDIAAGLPISDIDTVVQEDPWLVVAKIARVSHTIGLYPAMFWEYDVGALTSFWITADGESGTQLDLMHDPHGRGRYGLKTAALASQTGSDWPPRISDLDRHTYLLSKRLVKGDHERARNHANWLIEHQWCADDAARVLAPKRARLARKAISGSMPSRLFPLSVRINQRISRRGVVRLFTKTGVVVRLGSHQIADIHAVAEQLRAIFARVYVVKTVGGRVVDRLLAAALVRRPAVVIVPEKHHQSPEITEPTLAISTAMQAAAQARLARRSKSYG